MNGYIARIFTSFIDIPNHIAHAIYFSGCSIRCPGCQNKELWDKENGTLMSDDDVMKTVADNTLADYVAFLGGEPTDQLEFLIHMCDRIAKETKKPIGMYSGREFEKLSPELLKYLSFVVCGPFRQDLFVEGRFPASTNQRVFRKKGQEWIR